MKTYTIDGNNFSTLEEFWEEVNRVFSADKYFGRFGRNFDAFRDVFAMIDQDDLVVWKNAALSNQNLGRHATVKQLEEALHNCYPSARDLILARITLAKLNQGETVFTTLVEIIVGEKIKLHLE